MLRHMATVSRSQAYILDERPERFRLRIRILTIGCAGHRKIRPLRVRWVQEKGEAVMQIGVVFPQTEIGSDISAIRTYAKAVEDMGYEHLLAYDHVVGADVTIHKNWTGPYTMDTSFHEPLTLFAWLAGVAPRLSLVTGVIILPQRQAVLVAKQATQLDLLTGGR